MAYTGMFCTAAASHLDFLSSSTRAADLNADHSLLTGFWIGLNWPLTSSCLWPHDLWRMAWPQHCLNHQHSAITSAASLYKILQASASSICCRHSTDLRQTATSATRSEKLDQNNFYRHIKKKLQAVVSHLHLRYNSCHVFQVIAYTVYPEGESAYTHWAASEWKNTKQENIRLTSRLVTKLTIHNL